MRRRGGAETTVLYSKGEPNQGRVGKNAHPRSSSLFPGGGGDPPPEVESGLKSAMDEFLGMNEFEGRAS